MSADLSDAQWCFLDLLMRARQKGVSRVSRLELLNSPLPDQAKVGIVFGGLLLSNGPYVEMHGQHDFEITDAGIAYFNLRFGNGSNPKPTSVADAVILLPDQSMERLNG